MKSEVFFKEDFKEDNSNNMNIDMPFGNYIPTALNSFNLMLGFIESSDINLLSAILGFVMSTVWQLYRFYRQIKADQQAELEAIGDRTRQCAECQTKFEPAHINQIFCEAECKTAFLNNPGQRKPTRKKVKTDE